MLALGNLLGYLHDTQKGDLYHIDTLDYYCQGQFMELDIAARRNLELTETLRGKEKKGSLLWVLDKTKTAMGARMLRGWLERPLLTVQDIDRRADCVERLVKDTVTREELMLSLSGISDMERLMSRIVYGSAGGRDLVALRMAMEKLPAIKELLAAFPKGRLREIYRTLDTLDDLARRIADTLQDEPPFSVREGEFIRDGFHPEVDRLRGILHGGKGLMASMEAQEKEKTGIRTLKIGYNKVFGYYIEVSNSFKDQVPDTYIRKQTLVNGERYITQELKNLESDILTAADRVAALEFELFAELRLAVAGQVSRIQAAPRQWRSWTACALWRRLRSATITAAPRWTTPAYWKYTTAVIPWWRKCAATPCSCPTTPTWGRRRAGRPSSQGPIWRANQPICGRWPSLCFWRRSGPSFRQRAPIWAWWTAFSHASARRTTSPPANPPSWWR